jgi:predicted phosphodiesterase
MTRIAVLADIHANLPALEAVVDDIDRTGVDEVLVGGDLVGRGPQGREVIERVDDLGWNSIRGNHEDYLLQFRRRDVPDDWLVADIWAASRWMAEQIDDWHADYIDRLPLSKPAESTGGLRLVHGSPTSYQEGIGDWTSDETIIEHIDSIDESLLVCAHTHRPLDRRVANGRVVNVGSVGLPFNGDPRAQYAIFDDDGEEWSVEFRQVDYDRADFLQTYQQSGFLAEGGLTASILRMEVETARPFLVPFLKWTEIEEIEPTDRRFESFLEVYEPEMAMKDLFERFGEPDSE